MKSSVKILLFILFMLFSTVAGFSQTATQKIDTLRLRDRAREKETTGEATRQNAQGNAYGQAKNNNAGKQVKQVKAARPDMSKAKGARPPVIVRPSGSGIPKGIGRPGGVGRKGGR